MKLRKRYDPIEGIRTRMRTETDQRRLAELASMRAEAERMLAEMQQKIDENAALKKRKMFEG